MDELIRDGWFSGVIDIVSRGIGETLLGGNCAAGDDRLLAAVESGIPQVVSPSGLDMLSVGGNATLLEKYKDRPQAVIDKLRIEVRTSAGELVEMAKVMAGRLNRSQAPCAVLIPLKGWSSLDKEGRPLYDPAADRAFTAALKKQLKAEIPVEEVDLHLNTPEFGQAAVALFHRLYTQMKESSS
jgi:uncharacterized protein (UPF0261 family)